MKILVIDDSKAIRMLIRECVTAMGHEVIDAATGMEALACIQDHDVDLALMDVEMPGIDGFETTTRIRELKKEDWFPIIFLSSKTDDDAFTRGILAGGDAYLNKPIQPLRLQLQITAMERIYTMRRELHRAHQQLLQAQQELLRANEELKKLSLYDQLTGLANRRHFDEALAREFNLARRNKNPLSLIICDIDFFKPYNDRYGHQKGDSCLSKVALLLAGAFNRPTDLVCRYGGEEFTIILPDTDLAGVKLLAEKLHNAVWEGDIAHEASTVAGRITLSLGTATYTGQYQSVDAMLKAADDALYRAKANGRNRVESA